MTTPAIPAHDAEKLSRLAALARRDVDECAASVQDAYHLGVERGRAEQLAECERDLPEAIEAGIGWAETHPGVELLLSKAAR